MARRIRDHQSRQRIVEAAWRLVAQGGISAATMRGIAAEAGVTTGSVTHYFEDKGEILDAVLAHNDERVGERTRAAVGDARGLTAVREHTLAVLPAGTDGLTIWRVWLAFWNEGDPRYGVQNGPSKGWRDWRRGLGTLLRQAVSDGELTAELDPRYEADRIATLVAGIGLVYGTTTSNRRKIPVRARRMLDDHLDSLGAANQA